MIPDFGTLRDRATMPLAKYFYGMLCAGLARIDAALDPV